MKASVPPLDRLPDALVAHPDQQIALHTRAGSAATSFGALAVRVDAAVQKAGVLGLDSGACVGLVASNRLQTLVVDLAALACRWTLVHLPESSGVRSIADLPVPLAALVLEPSVVGGLDGLAWTAAGTIEDLQVYVRREPVHRSRDGRLAQAPAVVFSSGTTGRNKSILVDRDAVLPHALRFFRMLKADERDSFLVFLPLSNYQQKLLVYGCLLSGAGFCLSDMGTVMAALKSYRPTLFLAPPLFYESARNLSLVGGGGDGRQRLNALYGGRIRRAYSGMAPLPEPVLRAHLEASVPLYEAYGMTEFGPICANTPEHCVDGSVGRAIAPGSVTIAEDGEILANAPRRLTLGYLAEADRDDEDRTYVGPGSIATGDIGRIDEAGFVHILGRKKEIILTSQGYKIHPGSIERQFHDIAAVRHAVVLGNGQPHLGLVVVVERDEAQVRDEVRRRVDRLNGAACAACPIRRVRICTDAFTPDNGLLTNNMKLSRKHVAARYETVLFS